MCYYYLLLIGTRIFLVSQQKILRSKKKDEKLLHEVKKTLLTEFELLFIKINFFICFIIVLFLHL